MDKKKFSGFSEYMNVSYTQSEREKLLIRRIEEYNSNCDAVGHRRERQQIWLRESYALHLWYKERGYTREEYNRAKKEYWSIKRRGDVLDG